MQHHTYGATNGPLVLYFHGAPGGLAEAAAMHTSALHHGLRLVCQERFAADPSLTGDAYFRALADDVIGLAGGRALDIVGFSIGAFVALQVCRLLGTQVHSLHLVSAAAPLEGGDFLPAMAGRPVFQLAQRHPTALRALAWMQGLLATALPRILYTTLFSSAVAGDRVLSTQPGFRASTLQDLRRCFGPLRAGYVRDVQSYVTPWNGRLPDITTPTHLWHGDQDNWSPPAMARYLQQQLPRCDRVHTLQGQSHYSTLHAAAPSIFSLLAQGSEAPR